MTAWWWVRHAPVRGHDGICLGQLDVEADLSDSPSLDWLRATLPDDAHWISSPLARATATAAELHRGPVALEAAFAEQDFGDWQGRSYDTLPLEVDDLAALVPPSGESFVAVCRRVAEAIRRIGSAHAGRDIVVVGHAGSIWAALAHALDLAPARALSFAVDPLSLTAMVHFTDSDGWRIEGVNQRR